MFPPGFIAGFSSPIGLVHMNFSLGPVQNFKLLYKHNIVPASASKIALQLLNDKD